MIFKTSKDLFYIFWEHFSTGAGKAGKLKSISEKILFFKYKKF